jgi:hypothetical protein
MLSALPFVSWSAFTEVVVPADEWEELYASMQALKAHVQEYPGCQRFDVFVRPAVGDVLVHCYTTWDTPEQRDAFLERGYTFERLLADGDGPAPADSAVMEKIF